MKLINKILKYDVFYYIIALISIFLLYWQDFRKSVANLDINSYMSRKIFLTISILINFIIFILIIFVKKYKIDDKRIWILYIILAITIGIIHSIVTPLFSQSDEPVHFYRAYEISEGYVITPSHDGKLSNFFPKSFQEILYSGVNEKREYKRYNDIEYMISVPLNKDDQELVGDYSSYNFICYLPNIIGMKLGTILNLNPYLIGILGRISSLIICAILIGLGIKKIPYGKIFSLIIFLSPVVLSYFAAISADGIIIAASFLFISNILYFIKTKRTITKKDIIVFALLSSCLFMCKRAYFPIIGLYLLLPNECVNNKKWKFLYFIINLIIPFVIYMLISKISPYVTPNISDINTFNNIIKWIIKNPISYGLIVLRTTLNNSFDFLSNIFAGDFLCHHQISLYSFIPIMYIIIAVISYFSESSSIKYKNNLQKIFIVSIPVLIYLLIATAMYVYNTAPSNSVGYPIIIGIQGRYLIPLLPLLLFINKNKNLKINDSIIINISVILNLMVILSMIVRFSV